MRIYITADEGQAHALVQLLQRETPCAGSWYVTGEPEFVIRDYGNGLHHPLHLSQERWLVVCREEQSA